MLVNTVQFYAILINVPVGAVSIVFIFILNMCLFSHLALLFVSSGNNIFHPVVVRASLKANSTRFCGEESS